MFDIESKFKVDTERHRTSPFFLTDVRTFDWNKFITEHSLSGKTLDYLSFDVDEASMATLRRFPFEHIRFNVMTVEHDRYRFGQDVADEMRDILLKNGYVILCKDVCNDNLPYEDWWVHSSFLEMNPDIERFKSSMVGWEEVIKKIQTC